MTAAAALPAASVYFVFLVTMLAMELSTILSFLALVTTILFFPFFSVTFDIFIGFLIDLEVRFFSTTFCKPFLLVAAAPLFGLSTNAGLLAFTSQLKVLNYCLLLKAGAV